MICLDVRVWFIKLFKMFLIKKKKINKIMFYIESINYIRNM